MSLEKMIGLHPNVSGNFNEALALAARHAMLCALFCTSCADACSDEAMDMRQCMRKCHDCADICDTSAKLATRRTGQNDSVLREMLEMCITACEACAVECERHEHEHCRLCAIMCRECAGNCRDALPSIG